MAGPELYAPPARPSEIRELGRALPLDHLLPRPIHYVMAGGGSHGAVQWGLLQALSETDVNPDALIGTSAGALSGVVYAEDPVSGLNRLAYVWGQLDASFVVGDSWLARLANARQNALADNDTERRTLDALLTAETFADLVLPLQVVATSVATGRSVVIDSGPLIPALLASSAIPGALPPVEIGGQLLFDGLASANLPAMQAVHGGAGTIIVLDTGGRAQPELLPTTRGVLSRLSVILSAAQRRDQLRDAAGEVPVLLLPTPGDLLSTLDFRDTMKSAAAAYEMAREFLAALVADYPEQLAPGLYALPSQRGLGAAVADVLKPVTP